MLRPLFLIAALALLLPAVASAATLKVPGDHATIQAAVDAAGDGDVISVSGGPYQEHVTIVDKTNLTLSGKKVRLEAEGDSHCIAVSGVSNITITGFQLWEPGTQCLNASLVQGLTITKCDVVNSPTQGILTADCTDVLISKCKLWSHTEEAIRDHGSDGYRVEKCTIEGSGGGIWLSPYDGGAPGTLDATVVKNKLYDLTMTGIIWGGQNAVIEKNALTELNESGIEVSASGTSTNCRIEKNKITEISGTGIRLYGQECRAIKNKITGGQQGIRSQGTSDRAEGNSIKAVSQTGIYCEGSGATLTRNKISGSGEDGVVVQGGACTLTGNKVSGADRYGFYVLSTGNTLTGNKAKGSGTVDLRDFTGGSGNTYDGNKFGTEDKTDQ